MKSCSSLRVAFVLLFGTQKAFCVAGCWSVGRICATVRRARRKHKHVILSTKKALCYTMLHSLLTDGGFASSSFSSHWFLLQQSPQSYPFHLKKIIQYFLVRLKVICVYEITHLPQNVWLQEKETEQFGCDSYPVTAAAVMQTREDKPQTTALTSCCLN